jgi:hypothetical protein
MSRDPEHEKSDTSCETRKEIFVGAELGVTFYVLIIFVALQLSA